MCSFLSMSFIKNLHIYFNDPQQIILRVSESCSAKEQQVKKNGLSKKIIKYILIAPLRYVKILVIWHLEKKIK